jgi:hypothetical protein
MKNPDKAMKYLENLVQSIPTKSGGSQVLPLESLREILVSTIAKSFNTKL